MAKKKLKKVAEVGFVPGIYNYCDRWCEKCTQKFHCMSYAMGKKIEERGIFDLDEDVMREDENIWTRLRSVFESTYEVLHELAEERGIDVEDIYSTENIDKEFWGEDYEGIEHPNESEELIITSSDIIKICLIYEDMADRCLEKLFEVLDEQEDEDKVESGENVDEALDVINWYVDLIRAKMRRALYGYHHFQQESGGEQENYNGSAKVALIAIDRSVVAWQTLAVSCPGYKRDISHILVVLDQLLIDIEKQFREARNFRRPGFEA